MKCRKTPRTIEVAKGSPDGQSPRTLFDEERRLNNQP
jgi:hypothetical protein